MSEVVERGWKQKDLLLTFCKENGLVPFRRGDDIAIIFPTKAASHRVATIVGGAKRSPSDLVPEEIMLWAEKIQPVLGTVKYIENGQPVSDVPVLDHQ